MNNIFLNTYLNLLNEGRDNDSNINNLKIKVNIVSQDDSLHLDESDLNDITNFPDLYKKLRSVFKDYTDSSEQEKSSSSSSSSSSETNGKAGTSNSSLTVNVSSEDEGESK